MRLVTHIDRIGDLTIAKETFGYDKDLKEWISHMESLGCAVEPERREKLRPSPTMENFMPEDESLLSGL
jgi:hypothetical protein